jgi:LacI family transcriptional regulator
LERTGFRASGEEESPVATIYDVAEAAGVSISTVSHVLNETRFVTEETRAKVFTAIQQLNYRPNSLARAMVRQETRTIGLIVPDNANPFFAEMARGIENHGFAAGYSVLLCNSDRNTTREIAYLDMLISKRVDGVIYMTSDTAKELLQPMHEQRIPVVIFDRQYDNTDSILLDNYKGGYDATGHLIGLGHTRIACITGPDSGTRSNDRVLGYQAALADAGLPVDPDLILPSDWTFQSGHNQAQTLLGMAAPPTAIFACNDTIAIGAIAAVYECGLTVPGDVSIVGYDNITLSAFSVPPLTTMATPILSIGQRLCQLLLDRINGQLPPPPQLFSAGSQLLLRASTAPVRAAKGGESS